MTTLTDLCLLFPKADEGGTGYDCLVDYSNWLEGPTVGCAAEYNDGAEGASCMVIDSNNPRNKIYNVCVSVVDADPDASVRSVQACFLLLLMWFVIR